MKTGPEVDEQMVLLTEKCVGRGCNRVRYSELTDDANTHWHVMRGMPLATLSSLTRADESSTT